MYIVMHYVHSMEKAEEVLDTVALPSVMRSMWTEFEACNNFCSHLA